MILKGQVDFTIGYDRSTKGKFQSESFFGVKTILLPKMFGVEFVVYSSDEIIARYNFIDIRYILYAPV